MCFCFVFCHYIEVEQGAIHIEHKMRFELILGMLSILKKNGADYEQLLIAFLFMVSLARKKMHTFLTPCVI